MSKEPQPLPEEIKPYPFNGYAPGNYMNKCRPCGKMMERVDKLCFVCLECAIKSSFIEISTLEQTIVDYDKQVLELEGEIERLKLIIAFAHQSGWSGAQTGNYTIMKSWEDFKSKHNL